MRNLTMPFSSRSSVRSRMMSRIIPIVLGVFLLLGLLGALVVRSSAQDTLKAEHTRALISLEEQVNNLLTQVIADTRRIAADDVTRQFARNTLAINPQGVSGTALVPMFEALISSNLNQYLAVRYVTFTGAVWTEVSSVGTLTSTSTRIRPNELNDDNALIEALASVAGDVVVGGISFRVNPNAPSADRLEPFLRFASPVFNESDSSNVVGVIQIDVAADPIFDYVQAEGIALAASQTGRRLIIIDDTDRVLLDTDAPNTNFFRNLANRIPSVLSQQNAEIGAAISLLEQNEEVELAETEGILYSVVALQIAPNSNLAWRFILMDEQGLSGYISFSNGVFVLSLVFGIVTCFLINEILKRTLRPVEALREVSKTALQASGISQPSMFDKRISESDLSAPSNNEFEHLIGAFETLSTRSKELLQDSEVQRGRYNRNLDIAGRIGREAATLDDINLLLKRTVDLICNEFGYVQANVFRVDDIGYNAILVYGRGDLGQELLEKKYRVKVGSRNTIGAATATGNRIILNDTVKQIASYPDPYEGLLEQSRAQMVLPLQIGKRVIGAVDIQSGKVNGFSEEDARILQILADQIAVAMENMHLLQEAEDRVRQIDSLNQQLTNVGWEDPEAREGVQNTYTYDLLDVQRSGRDETITPSIEIPIRIRGQVIGSLSADSPEGLNFSSGDEALIRAVADRVGIAIENARLFESTQASLTETSTLYQLVRALNEATSLADVLESIAVSVMPDAISAQIGVFDEYTGSMPFLLEILADWNIHGNDDRSVELTGLQIHVAEHPILTGLQANQVLLVNDTEHDDRLDDVFRAIIQTTGGKSLVIIPFTVRGVWRGVFMAQFATTRSFGEREGRIFTALTDQAGVVIDNRMLLRQNEIALEQVERLYTASRSINMAQNALDLVGAATASEDETERTFELGIFEGALDETGWPSQIRVVASGHKGEVQETDYLFDIAIAKDSPLRYREPQITVVRDEGESSSLAQYARSQGFRYVAVFPLFSVNMPIALFFVANTIGREELSSEDYEVYRALTGQMSTVLENTRLLEQTQESLDETRRLYAASQDITSALDTASIYEASVRNLMSAEENLSRVSILLSSTSTFDAPYVIYGYTHQANNTETSDTTLGNQIKSEAIPFGEMLRESRLIVYNSLDDVADQPKLRKLLEKNKSRSAAIVSLQVRQQWYGLLLMESNQPQAFNEAFTRFAQALADQSSTAIESLRLFQEAQLQAQRALALAEAGQLSNRIGQSMEENIAEVFRGVAAPAEYDRWLLMLYNEQTQALNRVVESSPGRGDVEIGEPGDGMPISTIGIPLADAFNQQIPVLVNNPREYPDFPIQFAGLDDFAAYVGKHLSVPIFSNNTVIGALAVGRSLTAPDLGEADKQLGTTLAAQVAVAVENRNLFAAAENERKNLSSVLSTLPAGVLVLDAKTLLPLQFNQQATQLLGREVDLEEPFTIEGYNLYIADTSMHYPQEELPIYITKETGEVASSDNVAVRRSDGSNIALLINAAPIADPVTNVVTSIVVAFQDISALRGLESALQNNLKESITLYETSRSLSEGRTLDELMDRILQQIYTVESDNAFIILLEEQGIRVTRAIDNLAEGYDLPGEILNPTEVLLISDVARERKLDEAVRLALTNKNIYAIASLPMRSRSRGDEENAAPIGWIVITYSTPQVDLLTRENFLNTLTDTSAIAIDNRNLFRSTQNALQEANNLYQATTAISRVGSDYQLAETLRTTIATLKPDLYAGYIFTSETETRELFNENLDDAPIDFKSMIERHNLRNLTTLYIDDIREVATPSAFEQELLDLGNIRALAVVQIGSMGMLILGYHRPRHFDDSIGRYLSAISDSTAVIVDNIQLLSQIQSNLEETTTLYQASREIADATTPEEILQVAVTHLMDTPLDVGFIVMLNSRAWDQADAMVRVAASWAENADEFVDKRGVIWSANEFPSWRLLSTPTSVVINTQDEDAGLDFMEKAGLESMGLQSAAFIPLRAGGRPMGTIVLGASIPIENNERNIRVFRAFAEQASLRLDAARLLEQAERRARQLATSAEVSSFASSILDLSFLLPRIVDLIRDAFKYDHVQIFLMDSEDDFAELRASTGEAGRQLLDIKHKLKRGSSSVIGQVTATGKPTIASDTADARVIHRPNPYLPKTRSEMAIPLQLKGQVVGALDVQSNQPNAYDDDDIAVLTTLAAQISVAIDNAQLYEAAQNRAAETSFLFNVTSNAAGAETLRDALQNVAFELQAETEALAVGIYLHVEYEEDDVTHPLLQPIATAGVEHPLSEVSEINLDTDRETLLASIANNRRAEIITNISQVENYMPLNAESQSAILVPLVTGTQLVGVISLESGELHAFNNDNLTLMLTLSGSLSAIVQSQQLLEQVQRQNDQLRELDRLKSDFLANMSHELRTPLNSIIGFSRVILKGIDGPLTEMQEQDLTTIYNSGLHLLNLINDILDQAKIAAGKMDLQFDYFEMKSVIDGVRSIGIGLVKDKQIDIQVHIASGLKKAYGDEFRTRQVLLNLVSNAAKFTKEGTITLSVYPVASESGTDMLRVDVTDTGIGIAEKDLSLLFEAFRQVDSSLTRTQGGTGLGLVIAKSLVEMQGGEMLVESIVNTGSTFSIVMPTDPMAELTDTGSLIAKSTGKLVKTAPLNPSQVNAVEMVTNETKERPASLISETNEAPMLARPPMHVKRQILVIEDNPDMVDQFRRILQREGFDIFAASIPLEAEAMASGLHPTIIIMDVNFAEGQGWEILTRLQQRDDTRDIPVVVVTLSQEEERAADLGVFKFVKRPFMPEQLAEAVLAAEQESRIDRILIIDDQPESIRVLEDLLTEQGNYKVFSAASAMDGMSMVARRRPDLVIVDLRMPEMDGFDLIGELRANPETATIPIIVVTGDTLNEDEQSKLNKVPVMFKGDINAGQRTQFIEGVKTRLNRP